MTRTIRTIHTILALGALLCSLSVCCPGFAQDVLDKPEVDDVPPEPPDDAAPQEFLRGDANSDGCVDSEDAGHIFNMIFFADNLEFSCMDAADANDDNEVTTADAVYLISFFETGGPPPPAPFPRCGLDPRVLAPDNTLGCREYPKARCENGCESAPAEFLPEFIRGDANSDGGIDISDVLSILRHLFVAQEDFRRHLTCLDAADANDSGYVDISDAVFLLFHLFSNNREPRAPFPRCGIDPTEDRLTACVSPLCELLGVIGNLDTPDP